LKDVKKGILRAALSIGLCWGTGGVRFLGPLREKENTNLGSSSVEPEDTKSEVCGAIWNFSKEQGSIELISDCGAQRVRYERPRCIGTVRARIQMPINSQSMNE